MSTSLAFDLVAKDRASQAFDKVGKSADGMGGKVGKSGKFAEVSGKSFAAMGKLATGAGAAVAAAALVVGKGLLTAMDNEKVNDRLAASLGATPKMAAKYGKVASNLYAGAWGESMDEVSHAVEAVSSSFRGLGAGKHLEKVTAQAMDFATIFEIDLPRATSVASTMIRSGLAKNATQALDLLTKSAQKVPAALRENVLDAADEYGQFFHTIGMDGSQAMATLVQASKKGEFGIDKIGDAVKEFTIRSTDMSTSSKDAYGAIGLNAHKMANSILAGGKTAGKATKQIIDGLLGMKDPAKQANTAIALFGTPLEDLNVKDIPAFLKSLQTGAKGLGDFEGAAQKASDTLNDNAASKIESFKRTLSTAFVNVLGAKVLPKLEEFGGVLSTKVGPAMQKMGGDLSTKLGPPLRDLGKWIGDDVMPVLRELGGFIINKMVPAMAGAWASALEGLRGMFQNLGKGIEDNRPFIESLGVALKAVAKFAVEHMIPAIGQIYKTVLPLLGTAIGKSITVLRYLSLGWLGMASFGVKALRLLLNAALTTFSGILKAADAGLGWVPGLGDKIGRAKDAFNEFKDKTIVALDKTAAALDKTRGAINGIKPPKPIYVDITARYHGFKNESGKGFVDPTTAHGHNATGTPRWRGGMTWVGEQGPELVNLPRGSRVIPADRSRGRDDLGDLERAVERGTARALARLPILRIPDDGRAAYLLTGGI